MSKQAKIQEIENLIEQQEQPPRVIGNLSRNGEKSINWDLSLSYEIPEDFIIEVCNNTDDVDFFEANRERIKKGVESARTLLQLQETAGYKYDSLDVEL